MELALSHCVSAVAMETGSVTTDFRPLPVSSRDDADSGVDANMVRNAVVASVVGVGCVATFCLLVLFGVLHCHFTKDKGQF